MTLSKRSKEAIKTALAITVVYAIALSQNWENPYWAAIAVAVVSLASIGQSVNKAALRMAGTLMAMTVALVLLALFAQERWIFLLCLTLYGGFCIYMMTGGKHVYFWQVGWFVCVIIAVDAGPDHASAFEIGVLRCQQTGLGILVYSLIAIFLWPSGSGADFNKATGNLLAAQQQFYRACLQLLGVGVDAGKTPGQAPASGLAELQARARFDQLLDSAETDSREVSDLRHQWRSYQRQSAALAGTISRWDEAVGDVQSLDLPALLPGLETFGAEIDRRFTVMGQMLGGEPPGSQPTGAELPVDREALRSLSHLQTAAVAVLRNYMLDVERLSRALFETLASIKGYAEAAPPSRTAAPSPPPPFFPPDPDRLACSLRLLTMMWLAIFAVIYVEGIPGGFSLLSITGALGVALAAAPQLPFSKLLAPSAMSVLFAGLLYIFVMPGLSGFMGLGPLIFAVTFAICYLFDKPQQGLSRLLGLALFVVVASISNEQSYSFLVPATTALMFAVFFLIMAITAYFPFNLMPERVFLRQLRRFFRSCGYLISTMQSDQPPPRTQLARWQRAFHARELASLPAKLGTWAPHIDPGVLPGTSQQQVQALVTSLQLLAVRLRQLLEERKGAPSSPVLRELLTEFRAWQTKILAALQQLSLDPGSTGRYEAYRDELDEMFTRLEQRIRDALAGAPGEQLSNPEVEKLYRLLGAFHGTSSALVHYAGNASAIDWAPWYEERFA